jgi:chromosomal replication initiator protein
VWQDIVEGLPANQRAWLRDSEPVTLMENTAIIAVPNDFTRVQLEGRLRSELEDSLSSSFGKSIRIAVAVNPDLEDNAANNASQGSEPATPESTDPPIDLSTNNFVPTPRDSRRPEGEVNRAVAQEARLNPKYTFETFVIGSSNRFPHAAAVAVAEAPGKSYNPLLVYGECGVG